MLPGGVVDLSVVMLSIVVIVVDDNNVVVGTVIVDVGSAIDDVLVVDFDIIVVSMVVVLVDVFIEDVSVFKVVGFGDINGFVVVVVAWAIVSLNIKERYHYERSYILRLLMIQRSKYVIRLVFVPS